MATIEEDYVSFEVAKLLKEKGFDKDWVDGSIEKYLNGTEGYSLPTLAMAMKWLREACGLIISIEFQDICPTWKWRIYIKASNKKHTDFQHYNKYEEAVEVALKYALKNLI